MDMKSLKFKGNFCKYYLYILVTNLICFFYNSVVITDKSQAETKTRTKPTNKVNIERVRSELAGEEFKIAVTQPVKETVAAGKSIIGFGARLGQWFSSLVH